MMTGTVNAEMNSVKTAFALKKASMVNVWNAEPIIFPNAKISKFVEMKIFASVLQKTALL